jgi:uncharacterized Rmd1/YagE family protein
MSNNLYSRLGIQQAFRTGVTSRLVKFYSEGRIEGVRHVGQTQLHASQTQLNSKAIVGMQRPVRAGVVNKRAITRRRIDATDDFIPEAELASVMAACTAKMYDIPQLYKFMKEKYPTISKIQDDVLHVKISVSKVQSQPESEIFFFGDGCFVIWGSSDRATTLFSSIKDSLEKFGDGSLVKCETETLFFRINKSDRFFAGMEGETIVLDIPESEPESTVVYSKLAFSNGIADSVKLAVLESNLDEHIERVKPIPLALANGGKLPVGRADVLQLTGELLKFRADLNLHSELTDTPEWYWSEPQLEELYNRVTKVLDIRQRAHMLNKRLDYANELASVLRSHLSERHGLKLEWGIIALIAVEVAFETLHWFVGMRN